MKRDPLGLALGLFLFLSVTALHQEWEWTRGLHLELGLVIACLAGAVLATLTGRLAWTRDDRRLAWIALTLVTVPLVSAAANPPSLENLLALDEFRDWVKILLIAPLWYAAFTSRPRRELLIDVFLVAELVFAGIFVYHFFWLGEAREYDLRPTLLTKYGDPNFLCTFFAVGLPLAIYRCRVARPGWRPFYLAVAGVLLICAGFTESRMGLASIAVSAVYLLARARPTPRAWRRTAVVALCLAAGVAQDGRRIARRFANVADESNAGRLRSYRNGWALFERAPLFGNGWDYSPREAFENGGYPAFQSESKRLAVHDTPLQILADLGLYGFVAYGMLFLFVAGRIRRARAEEPWLAACAAASLAAFTLNFLTLPLETKDFAILFLILLACTVPRSDQRSAFFQVFTGDTARA